MSTLEILEEVKDAKATTPERAIDHLLWLEKIWRERDEQYKQPPEAQS